MSIKHSFVLPHLVETSQLEEFNKTVFKTTICVVFLAFNNILM